jgi:hypothetical protein
MLPLLLTAWLVIFTIAGLPPAQPTLRRVAAERRDNGTRG